MFADPGDLALKVPASKRGLLIGKKGATVISLQDAHRVKFTIPGPQAKDDEPVLVKGSKANCAAAHKELNKLRATPPASCLHDA